MTNTEGNTEMKNELPVRVYSASRSNSGFFTTIKTLFREFPAMHSLGYRFASRNISTRYRQSIFGLLWAFLPPLATAAIWIALNNTHVIRVREVGAPYPLFVVTGTMLWAVFVNAVMTPMQVFQSNRNILVKINFPREALIINAFYEILFTALINFFIIVIFLVIFKVDVTARSFYFFPGLFLLIVLGMSLGIFLLPFSLLFKDIQFILPTILQIGMYLTPILYATPPFEGFNFIQKLNLVTPLIVETRACVLNMDVHVPLQDLALSGGVAFGLFFIGVFLQRATIKTLIERMGS